MEFIEQEGAGYGEEEAFRSNTFGSWQWQFGLLLPLYINWFSLSFCHCQLSKLFNYLMAVVVLPFAKR